MLKTVPIPTYGASNDMREKPSSACIMEMVDYVHNPKGNAFLTDNPACSGTIIARIAAAVNDGLEEHQRPLMMKDFDRLFNTTDADKSDEFKNKVHQFFSNSFALTPKRYRYTQDWVDANFDEENYFIITENLVYTMQESSGIDTPEEVAGILTQVLDMYDEVFGPRVVPEHDLSVFYEKFGFQKAIIDA